MVPLILLAAAHPAVHGTITLATLYTLAGILAGVAIVATGFTKYVWPWMKRFSNFFSDWEGEAARPGVPERPGVMMRLETVEFDIASVKAEVHPNHGKSIKDVVDATSQSVLDLHDRVDAIDRQREGERVNRDG